MERRNSAEFEQAILLSLISNNSFRKYCLGEFQEDFFTDPDSRLIYSYLDKLSIRREEIGWLALENAINADYGLADNRANDLLDIIKTLRSYTAEQCESFLLQVKGSVEEHVKTMKLQKSMRIALKCLKNRDPDMALLSLKDLDKTIRFQERDIISLSEEIERMESAKEENLWEPGIPLNIIGLDTKTQQETRIDSYMTFYGLKPGSLCLIQASSNAGKTGLILNMAQAHFLLGYSVAVFSLEMNPTYLNLRTYSSLTGLTTTEFKDLSSRVVGKRLKDIVNRFPDRADIIWNDYHKRPFTPERFDLELTLMRNEGRKADVAYIDFIDLMDSNTKYDAEWNKLGGITREVQSIGASHGCLVIAASQSSKAALRDGSDGSTVGGAYKKIQFCDLNLALNRKDEDVTDVDGNAISRHGYYLTIDKNRFGEVGATLKLHQADLRKGRFFDVLKSVEAVMPDSSQVDSNIQMELNDEHQKLLV